MTIRQAVEAAVVVGIGLALTAAAAAQETPAPEGKQITLRPGLVIAENDLGGIYVERTVITPDGQWGGVEIWAVLEDGPVRLTACDDVITPCELSYLRIEGVSQGETFTLVAE